MLQVRRLIAEVDDDGTGEIGFEEFLEVIMGKGKSGPNPIRKLYHVRLGDPRTLIALAMATTMQQPNTLDSLAHPEPGVGEWQAW